MWKWKPKCSVQQLLKSPFFCKWHLWRKVLWLTVVLSVSSYASLLQIKYTKWLSTVLLKIPWDCCGHSLLNKSGNFNEKTFLYFVWTSLKRLFVLFFEVSQGLLSNIVSNLVAISVWFYFLTFMYIGQRKHGIYPFLTLIRQDNLLYYSYSIHGCIYFILGFYLIFQIYCSLIWI